MDPAWVHGRDQNQETLSLTKAKIVLIGAGSLGSQVASRLAQAGVGHICIADPECLESANVGRHSLGLDNHRKSKSDQLALYLKRKYPHGTFSSFGLKTWQEIIFEDETAFNNADLIISCIGEIDQELSLGDWHQRSQHQCPILYGWIGTQGVVGHALAITQSSPGLSCVIDENGYIRNPDTDFNGQTMTKAEPGCGTFFQPYGPLSVGNIELLVSRMALDILTRKITTPAHKVYCCSTPDLISSGGQWTEYHRSNRLEGYDGPLEYSRSLNPCGECYRCKI